MLFILGLVAAMIIGRVAGGRFTRLAHLDLRWSPVAIGAFGAQMWAVYLATDQGLASAVVLLSYGALIAVAARNVPRRSRVVACAVTAIAVGTLLNATVMIANGGWMPVAPETLTAAGRLADASSIAPGTRVRRSKDIVLPAADTRLEPLADRYATGNYPGPFSVIFSVGDVVSLGGAATWVLAAMGARVPRRRLTALHQPGGLA
jgi:hypothetical protein